MHLFPSVHYCIILICIIKTGFVYGVKFIEMTKADTHGFNFNVIGLNTFVYKAIGTPSACGHDLITLSDSNNVNLLSIGHDGWGAIQTRICILPDGSGGCTSIDYMNEQSGGPLDLNCDEYKPIWISWYNGYLTTGPGLIPGENQVLNVSYTDYVPIEQIKNLQFHPTYSLTDKLIFPPYRRYPQITSNLDVWETNSHLLFDNNNNTCLEMVNSSVAMVKFPIFSGQFETEFTFVIVGEGFDADSQWLYVYPSQNATSKLGCDGYFKSCDIISCIHDNGKMTCQFTCKCQCESVSITAFNYNTGLKFCEFLYPIVL